MSFQQRVDEAHKRVTAAQASGELSADPAPDDGSGNPVEKQQRHPILAGAAVGVGMAGVVAVLGVLFFLFVVFSSLCIICR